MNTVYAILYSLIWPFFNLFRPTRAIGRENIPEGGAVICANHTSLADPLFIVFAFRMQFPLRVMAKEELMRLPVLGWILSKAGIFGVARGKADMGAIKQALKFLKEGHKLLLFPEGTRVKEEGGGEAKTGAAMLAVRAGVPIVPVYLPKQKKWLARTPVVIGAPYKPEIAGARATSEEYQAIADEMMGRIRHLGKQVDP